MCLVIHFNGISQDVSYSSFTIPPELTKNANAVVRLNSTKVSINGQRDMSIVINRVVTVLNENGNRVIQAGSGYDKYVKIKKIEAIVYDKSGEEIKKFKKKDFIDHSAVDGGTLYSDSRVLFMGYTPVSYPYTVAFSCEVSSPNTAAIPSWKAISNYYVGVEKDVFHVQDIAGLGLTKKEKNLSALGDQIKLTDSNNSLHYEVEHIKALKPEDLSPSFSSIMPKVLFATEKFHYNGVDGVAKNWQEYGDWINQKLLKGRDEVSDETRIEIEALVAGVEGSIEKAKLIYNYVQENLRYISVQVGIGGIQPISAIEVDRLKYGDCKGLTNYTQALLKIAGVKSYYSIVEAGKTIVDFEDDFPTLAQGNHIILCIPDEAKNRNVWVDCTSQIHPFGFIGDFTDDRKVLVIKEGASEIVKTSKYKDNINHQISNAMIELKEDSSINSKLVITSKGIQYDNKFYIENESDKDIKEYYKEHWGYVNNLDISDYSFDNDLENVVFTEKLNVSATNYASKIGDRMLFVINTFNRNKFVPDRYRNRKLPFKIQRGYLDEDSFEIKIPDGYEVEAIPESVSLTNKYGEYSLEFQKSENVIFYKRKLLIKNGSYPKEEYKEYRLFRKSVVNNDNLKLVLKKTI